MGSKTRGNNSEEQRQDAAERGEKRRREREGEWKKKEKEEAKTVTNAGKHLRDEKVASLCARLNG